MVSSDHFKSRRNLYAQLAIILILILFALLKPRVQPWLEQNFPELSSSEAAVTEAAGTATDDRVAPSTKPATDTGKRANPPVVEITARHQEVNGNVASEPSASKSRPKEDQPKRQSGATQSRESGDEPPPGQLKLIGENVFRSTAGLVYRPGSRDGHRLKHILKHAKDDLQKPVHGVFEGDRDEILRWIDVAWIRAGKGDKLVRKRQENRRTAWTVNMQEEIGYVGGQKGQSRRKPPCRYLRLVLEDDGETVVTAYPVSSF